MAFFFRKKIFKGGNLDRNFHVHTSESACSILNSMFSVSFRPMGKVPLKIFYKYSRLHRASNVPNILRSCTILLFYPFFSFLSSKKRNLTHLIPGCVESIVTLPFWYTFGYCTHSQLWQQYRICDTSINIYFLIREKESMERITLREYLVRSWRMNSPGSPSN